MKKVLFLDDCNMFEYRNPIAYLVEFSSQISNCILHVLEKSQSGVYRMGGDWVKIMEDGKIRHTLISSGRKSDYIKSDYDEEYKLISGNY